MAIPLYVMSPSNLLLTTVLTHSGANASETTSNRTDWSPTGGSVRLEVHHPWALTYVNLGIGTNVSSFNVSLVDNFNQTGNGTFCLKNAGEAAIAAELLRRNMTKESLEGMGGSLQVIQITTTGQALYNVCISVYTLCAAVSMLMGIV
jgi:hypothetical protein